MKEYKSNKELIDLVIDEGLNISNKYYAFEKINNYSFYNIINTYKFPFKNDSLYKIGVTFNEIYSLYSFDKNLRMIFLKYLLDIEIILKSKISDVLSSNYGIRDYLKRENMNENLNEEIITNLLDKINNEIKKQCNKYDAFIHYFNNYGFIPPYVLMKGLSFGEVSFLYRCLKQKDQQEISKRFKLSNRNLKQLLFNFVMIRNICSHNDRLFTYSSKYKISIRQFNINPDNSYPNLFIIKESMKLLLPYKDSIELDNEINKEITKLRNDIKSIDVNYILSKMGFKYKENLIDIEIREYLRNQQELYC